MKKISFRFFGTVLTAGLLMPAGAAQVVPSLFAPAFCAARRNGMSITEASRFATRMSFDASRPEAVKVDGVSLDIKLAVYEAEALCPEAFGSSASAKRDGLTSSRFAL